MIRREYLSNYFYYPAVNNNILFSLFCSPKSLANFMYVSMTPYSCCKIKSPCYKNEDTTFESLPKLNETLINHHGCLPSLSDRILMIFNVSMLLCGLVVFFQVCTTIALAKLFKVNRCLDGNCILPWITSRSIERYDEEKIIQRTLDYEVCDCCRKTIKSEL